jgi:hypothetical protein
LIFCFIEPCFIQSVNAPGLTARSLRQVSLSNLQNDLDKLRSHG